MSIKIKYNQPREKLIFAVKDITDAYNCEMGEDIFYYIQDINIATASNNHNDLVDALNGLKGAIDNQDNDLTKAAYRLLNQVDMDYMSGD